MNFKTNSSNINHFLALSQEIRPPIDAWTPQDVQQFLFSIGFEKPSNIAIYNKIDGKKIKNFDEQLWRDTFGIHGTNELQKLRW